MSNTAEVALILISLIWVWLDVSKIEIWSCSSKANSFDEGERTRKGSLFTIDIELFWLRSVNERV